MAESRLQPHRGLWKPLWNWVVGSPEQSVKRCVSRGTAVNMLGPEKIRGVKRDSVIEEGGVYNSTKRGEGRCRWTSRK